MNTQQALIMFDALSQETRLDSTLTALEGVYRSSSWKITKPIRGLGRLLRRS